MPRKRLEERSLKGEGLAQNTGGAGPERKNRPSRNRPDAKHWQRVASSSLRAAHRSRAIRRTRHYFVGQSGVKRPQVLPTRNPTYFFINPHKAFFIPWKTERRKKPLIAAIFICYFSIFLHITPITIFTHPHGCAIIQINAIYFLVCSIFF